MGGNKVSAEAYRTPEGFLNYKYYRLRGRTKGDSNRPYLYLGLPICEKDEFVKWGLESDEFHRLFNAWIRSGYKRNFAPSPNRKDSNPELGYTISNLEWVPFSLNCQLGNISSKRKGIA